MKKVLLALALGGLLVTAAQADFVRVEAGVGMWDQSIAGDVQYNGNPEFTTDTLGYGSETKPYAWMYVKHFVPILPNLRLEYAAVEFSATTNQSFTFNNQVFTGSTDSTMTMDQLDAILYYNILDNTAWITVDLGLDIKSIDGQFQAYSTPSTVNVNESLTLVVPLAYGRGRVEIPGTGIGIEAEGKYIGYDNSKVSDVSIKADYTLIDMIPFVDLGIEAGYRKQTIKLDATDISSLDTSLNVDVDGVFLGIVGRF